jgi:hypothetical protein
MSCSSILRQVQQTVLLKNTNSVLIASKFFGSALLVFVSKKVGYGAHAPLFCLSSDLLSVAHRTIQARLTYNFIVGYITRKSVLQAKVKTRLYFWIEGYFASLLRTFGFLQCQNRQPFCCCGGVVRARKCAVGCSSGENHCY